MKIDLVRLPADRTDFAKGVFGSTMKMTPSSLTNDLSTSLVYREMMRATAIPPSNSIMRTCTVKVKIKLFLLSLSNLDRRVARDVQLVHFEREDREKSKYLSQIEIFQNPAILLIPVRQPDSFKFLLFNIQVVHFFNLAY
jgi:hypothetical protein